MPSRWLERSLFWVAWGLPLPLLLLNGWAVLQLFAFFQESITALIVATLLAFLLGYPIRGLQQRLGLRRPVAVLLAIGLALLSIGLLGATLIPLLLEQITALQSRLPDWISSGTQQLQILDNWLLQRGFPLKLDQLTQQLEAHLASQSQSLGAAALQLFPAAFGELFHWLLAMILTLYLLLHGDRFWAGLFRWLPTDGATRLRRITRETFKNYFLGQLTLAATVAGVMTTAFFVSRIPFALVFGLTIGLMALFPLGRSLGVLIVTILVSLKSIWLGVRVAVVAIALNQLIEYLITPLLIGRFTTLNPIWILLSLLVGAKLAGLLGIVLAIPVAATVRAILEDQWPEVNTEDSGKTEAVPETGAIAETGIIPQPKDQLPPGQP